MVHQILPPPTTKCRKAPPEIHMKFFISGFFLSRIPENWKKVDDMHFLLTPEHFFLLLFVLEIWRYIFITLWKYFCFIMFILFWHSVMGCSRRVRSGDGLWWVGYQLRHKINKTFNNNNNCILQFDEKRGRPHKTNLSTL